LVGPRDQVIVVLRKHIFQPTSTAKPYSPKSSHWLAVDISGRAVDISGHGDPRSPAEVVGR
jgi:hypothetical protein